MKFIELFKNKMTDYQIREYVLKEELNNYLSKNKKELIVYNVHEFAKMLKFSKKYYRICLKNNKGERFIYISNTQDLIIDIIIVSLDYVENNLNELIKIRQLLNNFFINKIIKKDDLK